ncbi:MAG: zf-HC2 domain-containing protein [Deltaproteobacteria bacterium]|nr:zf-HC2 domain-containing protein [Deltaproteobacteria bacterium]
MKMYTCKQMIYRLSDYMEKELPFHKRLIFRLHLWMCHNCRKYLKQFKKSVELTGKIPKENPPKALIELLEKTFKK